MAKYLLLHVRIIVLHMLENGTAWGEIIEAYFESNDRKIE